MTDVALHLGDCLEVMGAIPDASVDMILCDLPYGMTANKWDSVIPLAALWKHYKRIATLTAAIVLTAAQPFTTTLIQSNRSDFRYCWTWDKVNRVTGFLNAKSQPLRVTEDVVVFYREQPTYNPQMWQGEPYKTFRGKGSKNYGLQVPGKFECADGLRYPQNLIAIPGDERGTVGRLHPTQKPLALMEYLIKTYTDEGDVVLDNCMGSGSTGVACVNANRKFIGIEKDAAYFAIAERRISEAQSQMACVLPGLEEYASECA
jgi:site-specific DNA-methyltransferase (adenine-specific)